MATKNHNKIFKQIGDEVIELQGIELEEYLAKEEEFALAQEKLKKENEAKAKAKAALLERLGITQDEANLLLS